MFRARLLAGELLVGPMITLSSPETAELMAAVGFDWLFIDTEHTPMGPPQVHALLQAAAATPCVVRLPASDPSFLTKVLDAGAAGIIVPQVNTADETRRIVELAKYAPAGGRGRGLARAHRYGFETIEYSERANDTVAVIVQAESRQAVENIDEIVRVEGLDAVLIGPYDLASSLGRTGAVDHPEVQAAIERVRQACASVGRRVGMFGTTAEAVKPSIAAGFTLIVAGIDVLLLGQAAKAVLASVKERS